MRHNIRTINRIRRNLIVTPRRNIKGTRTTRRQHSPHVTISTRRTAQTTFSQRIFAIVTSIILRNPRPRPTLYITANFIKTVTKLQINSTRRNGTQFRTQKVGIRTVSTTTRNRRHVTTFAQSRHKRILKRLPSLRINTSRTRNLLTNSISPMRHLHQRVPRQTFTRLNTIFNGNDPARKGSFTIRVKTNLLTVTIWRTGLVLGIATRSQTDSLPRNS